MSALYVISRQRIWILEKTMESWLKTGLPVRLVVDEEEVPDYLAACRVFKDRYSHVDLQVLSPQESDRGLAYARRTCLEHAHADGHQHILMCDDDIKIIDDPRPMLAFMESTPSAAGCGIWFQIYRHFLGIPYETGVYPTTGSMGQQCIAINIEDYLRVGAYLDPLPVREDSDNIIRLVRAGRGPWYIHSHVRGQQIGKRFQPGGNSSHDKTIIEQEDEAYKILVERYGPELVTLAKSRKGGPVTRINWRMLYERAGIVFDGPPVQVPVGDS